VSTPPQTALKSRIITLLETAGYTRDYRAKEPEEHRGSTGLDCIFNVFLFDIVTDLESPANDPRKVVTFEVHIVRTYKRLLTSLDVIETEVAALQDTLVDETQGDFPSEFIRVVHPSAMRAEPLATSAVKFRIRVSYHFRKD